MKTVYLNPDYVRRVASLQAQSLQVNPPPIEFRRKKKANDDDDREFKKIDVRIDPTDEDSDELQVKAFLFSDGTPEEWTEWRIQFDDLARDMRLNTGSKKIVLAKALLAREAREKFNTILNLLRVDHELEAMDIGNNAAAADPENSDEDSDAEAPPAAAGPANDLDEDMFNETIERMTRQYFKSAHAYRRQQNYLRYHVFMMDMDWDSFFAKLKRQNFYLRYFPIPDDRESCESLQDDELVEIIDRAKWIEWQRD